MLEYFSYKKYKKNQSEKNLAKASPKPTPTTSPLSEPIEVADNTEPSPVLNEDDENFLQRIVSEEGPAPPLPARPSLNEVVHESANDTNEGTGEKTAAVEGVKEEKEDKKTEEEEKAEAKTDVKGKGKAKETDEKESKWTTVSNRLSFLKYLVRKPSQISQQTTNIFSPRRTPKIKTASNPPATYRSKRPRRKRTILPPSSNSSTSLP